MRTSPLAMVLWSRRPSPAAISVSAKPWLRSTVITTYRACTAFVVRLRVPASISAEGTPISREVNSTTRLMMAAFACARAARLSAFACVCVVRTLAACCRSISTSTAATVVSHDAHAAKRSRATAARFATCAFTASFSQPVTLGQALGTCRPFAVTSPLPTQTTHRLRCRWKACCPAWVL